MDVVFLLAGIGLVVAVLGIALGCQYLGARS